MDERLATAVIAMPAPPPPLPSAAAPAAAAALPLLLLACLVMSAAGRLRESLHGPWRGHTLLPVGKGGGERGVRGGRGSAEGPSLAAGCSRCRAMQKKATRWPHRRCTH